MAINNELTAGNCGETFRNWSGLLAEMERFDSKSAGDGYFSGPFFIIGMPRSGTKLLRDLMNEHPQIGITLIETHFLPLWIKNRNNYGDLSDRSLFSRFYRETVKLPYFLYMEERGRLIKEEVWYSLCRNFSTADIFEALIRHDAHVAHGSNKIWGDKTPTYLNHMASLQEIFPEARFIHIIRDVRDYCLSVKKAWDKNMVRAAQRWSDDIQKSRTVGKNLFGHYLEVRYEDLLGEPDVVLKRICSFLGIDFDPRMLRLSRPAENLGDAKGWDCIKKDNTRKYVHLMNPKIRQTIESISAPLLRQLGYSTTDQGAPKKIGGTKMAFYKICDCFAMIGYRIRERGVFKAIKWSFSFYRVKM